MMLQNWCKPINQWPHHFCPLLICMYCCLMRCWRTLLKPKLLISSSPFNATQHENTQQLFIPSVNRSKVSGLRRASNWWNHCSPSTIFITPPPKTLQPPAPTPIRHPFSPWLPHDWWFGIFSLLQQAHSHHNNFSEPCGRRVDHHQHHHRPCSIKIKKRQLKL